MSQTRKILSNTFWQVLGRVITAVIGVISIKIITNYLPTDVYGQYTTLYEFIGFFAIAADFGLYTIGVREMAKKEKPESEILANILSIRLILVVITLSLAGLAANLIPKYQDSFITSGIWIVAFTTGIALLNGTLSSILQYRLKMHYANVGIIISRIVAISYTAYIVFFLNPGNIEKGFNNLLVAGLVANLVMISLTYYYVRKESSIYFDFNWKYTKELTYKALPYGLALILSTIYFKLDIILLSLLKDYHQVGVYAVPLKLMDILSVIPIFLLNSALPALTETFRENKEKFQQTITKLWTFLTLLAAPIMIGGIVLAFPLTFIISNPQFLSGYHCTNNIQLVYQSQQEAEIKCQNAEPNKIFQWQETSDINSNNQTYVYLYGSDVALKLILVGMFFSFLNSLFAFSLVAMDKQAKLIITNLIGVLFNLITNLIFIPKYGFIGAAVTTAISEMIILGGTYYYANKENKCNIPFLTTFKILLAAILMGIVVYYLQAPTYKILQNFNILLLVPIGAIIYAAAIYLLKVISNDEIKKLLGRN
jgi:O-antigen/teichoic acid export membrane protein